MLLFFILNDRHTPRSTRTSTLVPDTTLYRAFSQAAGAASGGDLGWVIEGQLDPALDRTLRSLAPGQVSEPIRTLTGYHILLLRDQRRALENSGTDRKSTRLNSSH